MITPDQIAELRRLLEGWRDHRIFVEPRRADDLLKTLTAYEESQRMLAAMTPVRCFECGTEQAPTVAKADGKLACTTCGGRDLGPSDAIKRIGDWNDKQNQMLAASDCALAHEFTRDPDGKLQRIPARRRRPAAHFERIAAALERHKSKEEPHG